MTESPTSSTESPGGQSSGGRNRVRAWILANPAEIVDLFVYVVVLNLAIQYLPKVISESFTLSLLTAVLLKVALEVVLVVLWLIDLAFGGSVSLGGFLPVTLLVVVLLASRAGVRRLLHGPGGGTKP